MLELSGNPWDLFPKHKHLGTETSGNEIVLDLAKDGEGPVLGLWHDPAAILVLANSEAEFRNVVEISSGDDSVELPAKLEKSLFDRVTPCAKPPAREDVLRGADARFASWLQRLPAGARIADLRGATAGSGFMFDDASLSQFEDELVFAVVPPPPKSGILGRFFGR